MYWLISNKFFSPFHSWPPGSNNEFLAVKCPAYMCLGSVLHIKVVCLCYAHMSLSDFYYCQISISVSALKTHCLPGYNTIVIQVFPTLCVCLTALWIAVTRELITSAYWWQTQTHTCAQNWDFKEINLQLKHVYMCYRQHSAQGGSAIC